MKQFKNYAESKILHPRWRLSHPFRCRRWQCRKAIVGCSILAANCVYGMVRKLLSFGQPFKVIPNLTSSVIFVARCTVGGVYVTLDLVKTMQNRIRLSGLQLWPRRSAHTGSYRMSSAIAVTQPLGRRWNSTQEWPRDQPLGLVALPRPAGKNTQ